MDNCFRYRLGAEVLLFALISIIALHPVRIDAGEVSLEPIMEARSGIVRVRSLCMDGSSVLESRERTGFLIGEKGYEPYVITTAEGLEFSSDEKKQIGQKHKLDENAQISSEIDIIFQGDVEVGVSIVGSSEQKDLAILKLNQTLSDKYTLEFSGNEASKGMTVWLLTFPFNIEEREENYGTTDVVVGSGTIKNIARDALNDIRYLSYDIAEDDGALGGPVLAGDGSVLGMNVQSDDGGSLALDGQEIMQLLELHNVRYSIKAQENTVKHSRWPVILGSLIFALLLWLVSQLMKLKKTRKRQQGKQRLRRKTKDRFPANAILVRLLDNSSVALEAPRFTMGSSQGADYTITGNRKVSRAHAVISRDKEKYFLEDLGSTNGTSVNGKKLRVGERMQLADGDSIMLANEKFEFRQI